MACGAAASRDAMEGGHRTGSRSAGKVNHSHALRRWCGGSASTNHTGNQEIRGRAEGSRARSCVVAAAGPSERVGIDRENLLAAVSLRTDNAVQLKLYFLDGGEEYWQVLRAGEEPPVPQTKWILDQIQDPRPFTVGEIFRLNAERETLRAKALEHWNAIRGPTGRPVDAILCPVAPTLAPPHDTTCWWAYSSHWNLLDLPAVEIGRAHV